MCLVVLKEFSFLQLMRGDVRVTKLFVIKILSFRNDQSDCLVVCLVMGVFICLDWDWFAC